MKKTSLKTGILIKVICGKYKNVVESVKKVDKKNSFIYIDSASRIKFIKNSKVKNGNKEKKVFIPIHFSNVSIVSAEEREIT